MKSLGLIILLFSFLSAWSQPGIYFQDITHKYHFTDSGDTISVKAFDFIKVKTTKPHKEILVKRNFIELTYSSYELRILDGDYRVGVTFILGYKGDTMELSVSVENGSYTYPFKKGRYDFWEISKAFHVKWNVVNLPKEMFQTTSNVSWKVSLDSTDYAFIEDYKSRNGWAIIEQDYYGTDSFAVFLKKEDSTIIRVYSNMNFGFKTYHPFDEIDSLAERRLKLKEATVLFKDTIYLQYYDERKNEDWLYETNNLNSGEWITRTSYVIHPLSLISNVKFDKGLWHNVSQTKNGVYFIFDRLIMYYSKDGINWYAKLTYNWVAEVRNPVLWIGGNNYVLATPLGVRVIKLQFD